MGFAPSRSRRRQSVRKPCNVLLEKMLLFSVHVSENFNGPEVFKVMCVCPLFGVFLRKDLSSKLYTIHKSSRKPFFLPHLGLPGNFTSHLVTIQIPKTLRLAFAADIAGLKRKMLLCRKETPQKVRYFINRIGPSSAIFIFIAKSVLWRAIAVNAWCLSRNYLKLPEGLLGSFGFKGLSCPKTGEFDYNPLPSVPSMLCQSENGRVHHWLVPIWRQKEVADRMWSIQILVAHTLPKQMDSGIRMLCWKNWDLTVDGQVS